MTLFHQKLQNWTIDDLFFHDAKDLRVGKVLFVTGFTHTIFINKKIDGTGTGIGFSS